MLRKLLKHEFRATARIMGPLYLILLVTAMGANFSARVMDRADSRLLNALGALVVMAFVVAIIGVCFMSFFLMLQRFYRNLLRDEGYIMFTLPASVHQQVWSKLIVSTVWYVLTAAVVVLSFLVAVFEVGFVSAFAANKMLADQGLTAATATAEQIDAINKAAGPYGILSIILIIIVGAVLYFGVLPKTMTNDERKI